MSKAPEYVSFEQLDREHREERARDAERLRTGEVTPALPSSFRKKIRLSR